MENSLFDLPEEPTEAPDVAGSPEAPLYPPPDRACLVCGERMWQWNPEKRVYACGGNRAAHEEYVTWHQATFPWLVQA
jgi:hypothetical protein